MFEAVIWGIYMFAFLALIGISCLIVDYVEEKKNEKE